jgi:hypothetical protein
VFECIVVFQVGLFMVACDILGSVSNIGLGLYNLEDYRFFHIFLAAMLLFGAIVTDLMHSLSIEQAEQCRELAHLKIENVRFRIFKCANSLHCSACSIERECIKSVTIAPNNNMAARKM